MRYCGVVTWGRAQRYPFGVDCARKSQEKSYLEDYDKCSTDNRAWWMLCWELRVKEVVDGGEVVVEWIAWKCLNEDCCGRGSGPNKTVTCLSLSLFLSVRRATAVTCSCSCSYPYVVLAAWFDPDLTDWPPRLCQSASLLLRLHRWVAVVRCLVTFCLYTIITSHGSAEITQCTVTMSINRIQCSQITCSLAVVRRSCRRAVVSDACWIDDSRNTIFLDSRLQYYIIQGWQSADCEPHSRDPVS